MADTLKKPNPLTNDRIVFLLLVLLGLIVYQLLPINYAPYPSIIDDQVEYAIQAESQNAVDWFHPHHILNAAIHRLVWVLISGPELGIRVIYVMRWTSHLSMGLVLGLLFLLARRMKASRKTACLIALIFAAGAFPWTFGSIAETVAPTTATFLALLLGLFFRKNDEPPDLRTVFWLGLLYSLNVTIHQMQVIYLPVLLLGMSGYPKGQRLKRMGLFLLASGILVVPSYLYVIIFLRDANNVNSGVNFLTTYAKEPYWGKGNWNDIVDSLRTLVNAQSYSFFRWKDAFSEPIAIMASVSTFVVGGFGLFGWFIPSSRKNWRWEWGWLLLFFLIHVPFITWWEAKAWDFWVLPWALIILGVARWRFINPWVKLAPLLFILGSTAYYNYLKLAVPRGDEEKNVYYAAAHEVSLLPKVKRSFFFTETYHTYVYFRYWSGVENVLMLGNVDIFMIGKNRNQILVLRRMISNVCNGKLNSILLDENAWSTGRSLLSADMQSWYTSHSRIVARERDIEIWELHH